MRECARWPRSAFADLPRAKRPTCDHAFLRRPRRGNSVQITRGSKMVSLPKGIETPTGTIRPLNPRLSAGQRTIFAFLNFLAPSKISCRSSGPGVGSTKCCCEARGAPGKRRRPKCRVSQRSPPTGRKTGLAWPLRSRLCRRLIEQPIDRCAAHAEALGDLRCA